MLYLGMRLVFLSLSYILRSVGLLRSCVKSYQVGLLLGSMYESYGMKEKSAVLLQKHASTLELLLQLPELSAAYQDGIARHRKVSKTNK